MLSHCFPPRVLGLFILFGATAIIPIAAAEVVGTTPPHERVLGLQGAPNFRDIGGYETADGRHVRWGLIYRSNKLSALTPEDEAKLDAMHIAAEIDLRTLE